MKATGIVRKVMWRASILSLRSTILLVAFVGAWMGWLISRVRIFVGSVLRKLNNNIHLNSAIKR